MNSIKIYKKWWFYFVIWIILSLALLKIDGIVKIIPFIYIWLYLFLFCVIYAFKSRIESRKLALSYFSVLPFVLGAGELITYFKRPLDSNCMAQTSGEYTKDYFISDGILGYKGRPNTKVDSKKIINGRLVYDVVYSMDASSLRITPNSNENSKKCLLFFGDSFTIGEGVNDNETLPFYLNEALGAKFRVYNFGFHGYGPHQALALLKSDAIKDKLSPCIKIHSFIEILPDHIKRANSFSPWEDTLAPRFKLKNGNLIWINEKKNIFDKLERRIFLLLKKSYLFESIFKYKYSSRYNALFFALLEEIDKSLQDSFNSKINLIFFDSNNLSSDLEITQSRDIDEFLKKSKIKYFRLSDLSPSYKNNRLSLGLDICDLHPNSRFNKEIALALISKLRSEFEN